LAKFGQVEHFGTVKGHVNHIKGDADLSFNLKGSKKDAQVHFAGTRYKNTECWISSKFTISPSSGDDTAGLDLHDETI
jgi:hypothetical protein